MSNMEPAPAWWAIIWNPRKWMVGRYEAPSGRLRVWQFGPVQRGRWSDGGEDRP